MKSLTERMGFLSPAPRYRGLRLFAAVMLVGSALVGLGITEANAGAKVVGRLDRMSADVVALYGDSIDPDATQLNGQIILVPKKRALIQVFQVGSGLKSLVLAVRDLDTLALRKTVEVPVSGIEINSVLYYAMDHLRDRVFITDVETRLEGRGYVIFDVGNMSFEVKSYSKRLARTANNSMVYDARKDHLYSLQATTCANVSPGCPGALNYLSAINATTGEFLWSRVLRSCRGTRPVEYSGTPDPSSSLISAQGNDGKWRLHIPCWVRQEVSGVVAVFQDEPNDTTEGLTVGPPQMATFFADHKSGRLVIIGKPGGGEQEEGFVYDGATSAFVGAMSLSRWNPRTHPVFDPELAYKIGYGLDPDTGVLFGLSNTAGLFSTHLRMNPIPQPETYAGYPAAYGSARLWYDSISSRVFVLPFRQNPDQERNFFHAPAYDIVSVPKPLPVPPTQDPDRNTINLPESSTTSVSYAATGSAYGLRILLARGLQGAAPATGDSLNAIPRTMLLTAPNKCGFIDRQFVFALIGAAQGPASLTDTGAAARAGEVEVDDATKIDLQNPSRCDQTLLSDTGPAKALDLHNGILSNGSVQQTGIPEMIDKNIGRPWAYKPAECSGDDRAASERAGGSQDLGSASVSCKFGAENVEAESLARVDFGNVKVAYSKTTVKMLRKPGEASIVESDSIVRGLLVGSLTIGEIHTHAIARSGGRPGTAIASFTRQMKGVILPDQPSPISCRNEGCDQLLTRLNAAFSGRAEFRFPPPDAVVCRPQTPASDECLGTPRGAQAGIIKSEFRRSSDKAMTGDSSREIPGLEILIYNDNQWAGRARELIQIAGVQATSSYNISELQEGFGFGPLDDFGEDSSFEEFAIQEIPPFAATDSPGLFKRFFRKVIKPIADGLLLLFASPREAARAATAWVLLAAPVIMSIRRRRLLDLHRST